MYCSLEKDPYDIGPLTLVIHSTHDYEKSTKYLTFSQSWLSNFHNF